MYDYKNGKIKIENILNSSIPIQEKNLPKDDTQFTYDNGVKCWIGSIFVDIIKSSDFIGKQDEIVVAKILRAFTSEIISIMNLSDDVREIGVRGDCVYGIFSTPLQGDIYNMADISFHINTYMNMLNKILIRKGYPQISAGIGVAVGNDLVIKAGCKGTGINDRIWIGDAIVRASKLSNYAGRFGRAKIAISSTAYDNLIEQLKKNNPSEPVTSWFSYDANESCYLGNIIKSDFDKWIDESC